MAILKPWVVIKQLLATTGRLEKEAILERNMSPELIKGMEMTFDPFLVFHIKKLPKWKGQIANASDYSVHDEFKVLATALATRTVTGNAAKEAVEKFASYCTEEQWEMWFSRILMKDFKIGVAVNTWNKISENRVYIFECQLATDSDKEKYDEILSMGDVYIEPKLDGARALAFVYPNGDVQIFSRNGRQLDNFTGIEAELSKIRPSEPIVLDGEMMGANFQDLMTQINRKSNVDTSNNIYHVFDAMTKTEFVMRTCKKTQRERRDNLEKFLLPIRGSSKVVVSPYFYIQHGNKQVMKKYFDDFVAQGFEGMMIKPTTGKYEFKRTKAWLKMKPFVDVTLTIVDMELGSEGTKYANVLGNMICEGVDKGRKIKVSCGGGFDDKQRTEFWANRKSLIGKKVDVRADALSLAAGEDTYSLRFPRFERFREEWDLS